MTHWARALLPNGFRFRFIPRKVPGLSANPLGFRGGAGTMVVGKVPIWTAVRHLSRRARKVSADRPGLAHFLPATFMPIPPLCFCALPEFDF